VRNLLLNNSQTMTLPTRRTILKAGAALLAGCSGPTARTGPYSGKTLRVFVYAGGHEATMRAVFVPAFEAATGATVQLETGWWDSIAKLKSAPRGAPPFDLMITDATQGYPAAREGLFAELNLANIPNAQLQHPMALEPWVYAARLGVPYPDSVMTFATNREQVPEEPRGWRDLFRADLRGKLGLYSSYYMSLFTFAAAMVDAAGNPGTAQRAIRQDLDAVFRFAREHRTAVQTWWPNTTDMILQLSRGQVAGGNMHSPEYLAALREQKQLRATIPVADRAMVLVFWAVPAGSPNQDLAERAMNMLFSPELQRAFAERGMATALPEVAQAVAQTDPLWGAIYPQTSAQFAAVAYYPYDFYAEHARAIADRWDRTILRGD
ncbi:MAG: ABC transporter substrate-binding protein, partial [Gemmataceae bacterium]